MHNAQQPPFICLTPTQHCSLKRFGFVTLPLSERRGIVCGQQFLLEATFSEVTAAGSSAQVAPFFAVCCVIFQLYCKGFSFSVQPAAQALPPDGPASSLHVQALLHVVARSSPLKRRPCYRLLEDLLRFSATLHNRSRCGDGVPSCDGGSEEVDQRALAGALARHQASGLPRGHL